MIVQHLLLNKLLILTPVQEASRHKGGAHSPYSAGACPMGTCPHVLAYCSAASAQDCYTLLASCLNCAPVLLEYIIFIMWLRSVIKMLSSVKFDR